MLRGQALGFYLGAVPPDLHDGLASYLIKDIMVTHSGHQNAGIIGTKYLYEILTSRLNRSAAPLLIEACAPRTLVLRLLCVASSTRSM
jgi:hypothetical protein